MKRILLLATTTGYQTRMFEDAAARRGVGIVYATDRCDQLPDPWQDRAIAVRFRDETRWADLVVRAVESRPVDGVLAVGDRPVVLAAEIQQRLGLPGHAPAAAAISRDKRLMRARIREAGLLSPPAVVVSVDADPVRIAQRPPFPVVVKPTVLSGSRGVIRADDEASLARAFARVRRLLAAPDVHAMQDPSSSLIQVEGYIDGVEYAVEALMEHGRFRVLAIFDKPDPLVGPHFEETIYVTPPRADDQITRAIASAVERAARAIGLEHGPIHAECRVAADGVYVLEVAARPIGGLCARALRFVDAAGARIGLEELLLDHALGEPSHTWSREPAASGVMMIPIPKGGVFRRVDGLDEARATAGIEDITITAKPDQLLVPLPEGASYLGFIFARAHTPELAERALRQAHAALRFTIDVEIPVLGRRG